MQLSGSFRLKELNATQEKKGWDVVRNDLSMDRMEKKLNQIAIQMRHDFEHQQQKVEEQMKMDLDAIKEILQEIRDEKKDAIKTRTIPAYSYQKNNEK